MAKRNQEIQNVDYRMGKLKNQEKDPFLFRNNQHKPIHFIYSLFRSIFKYNILDYYIKTRAAREWVS